MSHSPQREIPASSPSGPVARLLNWIERVGNKLPDPVLLFVLGIVVVAILSAILSAMEVSAEIPGRPEPVRVTSLLTLEKLASFLAGMVTRFTSFPPLGVVLVAMLGVGVAEASGFLNACMKAMLRITPRLLLTPMLILVAILSHTAADAGYVLVIPIGGVMFYAAGRHPLAGIAAAFAGVSGGFGANLIPSGIDPLLAGMTQAGAEIAEKGYTVNPLCNWYFTAASSMVIVGAGWILTDLVVEPRLRATAVDGDPDDMPAMGILEPRERKAMACGIGALLAGVALLVLWAWPESSALRARENQSLTSMNPRAPLMDSIVPLIFLLFILPGIIHGYVSGTFKSHRDVVKGMSRAMESMAYYLVLVFFTALFVGAFTDSGIGNLLAIKGANLIKSLGAPPAATIVFIILLTTSVNLLIGSASSKWAMLAPIFVPMLMYAGISPEFTQGAFRVGDSCTNIITPLMPYFPLIVVFCQRYVKQSGIGTVAAMMLPYTLVFLVVWTLFLLGYWSLGFPLGLEAGYTYPR